MEVFFNGGSEEERRQWQHTSSLLRKKAVSFALALSPEVQAMIGREEFHRKLVAVSLEGAGIIASADTFDALANEVRDQYGGQHLWTTKRGGSQKNEG